MDKPHRLTGLKCDRRTFLKTTAAFGAGMSGATLSFDAKAAEGEASESLSERHRFSQLDPDFIYLNSGTEGSMSTGVIDDFSHSLNTWASDPTTSYETNKVLGKQQHHNRQELADYLRVGKNNISLTDNTTMGLSMVISGLNFTSGDKVIITNHEHNAIVSPLAVLQDRIGLTVHVQPFPAANKLKNMDTDTLMDFLLPDCEALRGAKALCVSHVYPATGLRLPLHALRLRADQLGIQYLVVDGAQAFGAIDVRQEKESITHADFYACPGHKWLNGPPGTGLLYLKNGEIRPPEFYPMLSQRMPKYSGGTDRENPFPMAEALQVRGCSNTVGFTAMMRALRQQDDFGGADKIEQHIVALSAYVKNFVHGQSPDALVSPLNTAELQSGLTVFFPFRWDAPGQIFSDEKTVRFVVDELLKQKIQIRYVGFKDASQNGGNLYALRVSTAVFTTEDHITRFKAALEGVLRRL